MRLHNLIMLLVILTIPVSAWATTLTSHVNVEGGVDLDAEETGSPGTPESIVRDAGSSTYEWADKAGDDSNSPATSNLYLGAYQLCTSNAVNTAPTDTLTLNLNGGDIFGDSGHASISTRSYDPNTEPSSHNYNWNGPTAGDLNIYNVRDIACGGLESFCPQKMTTSPTDLSGDIRIGQSGTPARNIRVDHIYIACPDGAAFNRDKSPNNFLLIYSTGNVLIENSSGTAGDIIAWDLARWSDQVDIFHDGAFRVNNIEARAWCGNITGDKSQRVLLEGDWVGDGASGSCTIEGSLLNSQESNDTYTPGANEGVFISGYTNVTVGGNITCGHDRNHSSGDAGDITIEDIEGDITISGTVRAKAANASADDGILLLATTGPNAGTITIGSLDMEYVRYAQLEPGNTHNYVTGVITNFDTTASSGSGLYNAPFITTQVALRLTAGTYLIYDGDQAGNAPLSNAVYKVADLSGTAGTGGLLIPESAFPPKGTVIFFR